MIRSLPIDDQRHRALRAVLARIVMPSAGVPVAGVEAGRDDMFLVRGVDEAEESRWDDGHDVEFAVCKKVGQRRFGSLYKPYQGKQSHFVI